MAARGQNKPLPPFTAWSGTRIPHTPFVQHPTAPGMVHGTDHETAPHFTTLRDPAVRYKGTTPDDDVRGNETDRKTNITTSMRNAEEQKKAKTH